MNLATVKSIYTPIGKEKFNSLMRNEVISPYKRTLKVVAEATVNRIADLIKKKGQLSRAYLIKHSGQSKSTTEAVIRIIFESGLIRKEKNTAIMNHPTFYIWNEQ